MVFVAHDADKNIRYLFTDSSGRLYIIRDASSNVYNGQNDVANAGTAEALGSDQAIVSVTIIAKTTNTGNIYVGDSSVDNSNGAILPAGDSVSLDIDNLDAVYIDSDNDGEGVSYIAIG